ncbi:hypothetical protein niasHT_037479 [Heterodera trifolii]|uniref:Transmembrane protein n=1 Tax=Heterodera trifolii TaxID=157864 RepID=A0ABD2IU46_9BILA
MLPRHLSTKKPFVVVLRFPFLLHFLSLSLDILRLANSYDLRGQTMNRFSTAHKLNKSIGIYNPKNANSYKQQLLDVIALQQKQSENGSSSSSVPFSPPSATDPFPLVPSVSAPPPTESTEFGNGNMKSKHFGNGDGELDMLFGFFIMNGACIVFFLLFGVCVICNCAARKPKFHGSEEKKKKPTVSRLVAAIAPGGFSAKEKAKESVATQKMEENGGNTPLLLPEKKNSDDAKKSEGRRTGKSFRSLVVRAMAASREEMPQGAADVERQQSVAADNAAGGASPPSTGVSFASGAPPDRPSAAQRCPPSDSRRTSGASSRRPSAVTNCCSMTASVLTHPPPSSADSFDQNNNKNNNISPGRSADRHNHCHSEQRKQRDSNDERANDSIPGRGRGNGSQRSGKGGRSRTIAMVTFAEPTETAAEQRTTQRGGQAVTERAGDEQHKRTDWRRNGGRIKAVGDGEGAEDGEEDECGGCCSVHVIEVPVEVEMQYLCHQSPQHILLDPASPPPSPPPPPFGTNSLLPPKLPQFPSHRCAVSPTRSVPSDLCKAAQQQKEQKQQKLSNNNNNNNGNAKQQQMISRTNRQQQNQSVRLNHCGDFAVIKRSDWTQLSLRSPPCHHQQPMTTHPMRHRCSLVVPVTCECHEMEEEEGEEKDRQREESEREGEREKQSDQGDQQQFSVIRQNLLGPLSFDDLYYM